jgi:hypothetical protein
VIALGGVLGESGSLVGRVEAGGEVAKIVFIGAIGTAIV